MDAVRQHRHQIHRLRAGSDASRSLPPMVGTRRRLGFLPRSVALGRLRGILRRTVSCRRRLARIGRRTTSISGNVCASAFWRRTISASLPTTPVRSGWDLRLISPRTENAYQNVTYPKGAYVLEMLRSMMYSQDDQDKAFIGMMHDFVESHRDRPASTESFKAIAEKHMTKVMDVAGQRPSRLVLRRVGLWYPGAAVSVRISSHSGGRRQSEAAHDDHAERGRRPFLPCWSRSSPTSATAGFASVRSGVAGNTTRSADAILPSAPKKVALNQYKEILER